MIQSIHVHNRVEKNIFRMKSSTNAPRIAAQRAQGIIDSLICGFRPAMAGLLSVRKDRRINGLFKFNLGKGFRLVTIKSHSSLYVIFIGPHDLCDRYLDTYSKKKPHKDLCAMKTFPVKIKSGQAKSNRGSDELEDLYCPEISQEDLRRVFCGIVGDSA